MSFVESYHLALLLDILFIGAIAVLVIINLKHMILPNVITYPGCALAIVARGVVPNLASFGFLEREPFLKLPTYLVSIDGAIIGAVIGGGALLFIRWVWEQLRGVEALGLGDVKMMGMVGAYLGIAKTLVVLALAFALMLPLSTVVALILIKQKNLVIPSGFVWGVPAIVVTLLGEKLLGWLS